MLLMADAALPPLRSDLRQVVLTDVYNDVAIEQCAFAPSHHVLPYSSTCVCGDAERIAFGTYFL
jgi:hypothetical protein